MSLLVALTALRKIIKEPALELKIARDIKRQATGLLGTVCQILVSG